MTAHEGMLQVLMGHYTSGVSIAIIKEVLGHTDIRTTQKYAHVDVLAQSRVFAAQTEKTDYPQTIPTLKKKLIKNNENLRT